MPQRYRVDRLLATLPALRRDTVTRVDDAARMVPAAYLYNFKI